MQMYVQLKGVFRRILQTDAETVLHKFLTSDVASFVPFPEFKIRIIDQDANHSVLQEVKNVFQFLLFFWCGMPERIIRAHVCWIFKFKVGDLAPLPFFHLMNGVNTRGSSSQHRTPKQNALKHPAGILQTFVWLPLGFSFCAHARAHVCAYTLIHTHTFFIIWFTTDVKKIKKMLENKPAHKDTQFVRQSKIGHVGMCKK